MQVVLWKVWVQLTIFRALSQFKCMYVRSLNVCMFKCLIIHIIQYNTISDGIKQFASALNHRLKNAPIECVLYTDLKLGE